jgi:hypothetical protein
VSGAASQDAADGDVDVASGRSPMATWPSAASEQCDGRSPPLSRPAASLVAEPADGLVAINLDRLTAPCQALEAL